MASKNTQKHFLGWKSNFSRLFGEVLALLFGFFILKNSDGSLEPCSQVFVEWHVLERTLQTIKLQTPAMGKTATYKNRLPRAAPNLSLDMSRDGASAASLGNLFHRHVDEPPSCPHIPCHCASTRQRTHPNQPAGVRSSLTLRYSFSSDLC